MSANKVEQLQSVALEFNQLHTKVTHHIKERKQADGFIYATTFQGLVNEYNLLVKKYNSITSANLSTRNVSKYELSSTGKTVRVDIAESFSASIKAVEEKIGAEITEMQSKEAPTPLHQMRVCFKTRVKGCPIKPQFKPKKVFIAMPFNPEYIDSYEYGIKIALDQSGIEHVKADKEISNKDIMCKVCEQIQSCGKVIANISGLNPNVMLELGLAYGLGKDVIVIKDKKTTAISDLGSIEYIEYEHAGELQQKLITFFK
mgnify:CR=1 FL=1